MDTPSTSAAALREEIARLAGAIDKHKATDFKSRQTTPHPTRPRNNVYINPNYKPPSKAHTPAPPPRREAPAKQPMPLHPDQKRDVVLNGVAFESSGRSLVRKDLAVSRPAAPPSNLPTPKTSFASSHAAQFASTKAPPSRRVYKPKTARRGRPMNRNMTLTNNRRPNGARRRKYVDKPCPRFTTTGACNRGLTCPYQHDPSKIAICWPFLQGSCPHNASTCSLSHDPTPQRTPLCVHFANAGRCTRANCPFPHVRVGPREGVCRDFAVLGYCEKGLDCGHQHVRECPDFAEKGVCTTKGCKLPHVIRANRNRPKAAGKAPATNTDTAAAVGPSDSGSADSAEADSGATRTLTAEDAQLGDEFISLTFNESESDDDEEDDDQSEEAGDEDEEAEEHELHADDNLNVHLDE